MIGWELDCPALDALGEGAGEYVVISDCRVLACGELTIHGEHCEEHATPKVHEMVRPHAYVYQGRRIVLESTPWEDDAPAAPAPQVARSVDARPPAPSARTCWAWCGRSGPGPHCHPASRFGHAPTSPCLACGRATFSCQHPGLCCSEQCSAFWRDLCKSAPAETATRWLSMDEPETWEERSSLIQDSGLHRDAADRRALAIVWRSSRGPGNPTPSPPTSSVPAILPASQLNLF